MEFHIDILSACLGEQQHNAAGCQYKVKQKTVITKIHQLDSSIRGEQDIVALDVPMDYSVVVQMLQALMWKKELERTGRWLKTRPKDSWSEM